VVGRGKGGIDGRFKKNLIGEEGENYLSGWDASKVEGKAG